MKLSPSSFAESAESSMGCGGHAPPAQFSFRRLWRAEFFSPRDLVKRAILITLFYGIACGAGLKDYTSVLSNTTGSVEAGFWTSAFLGLAYICLYLAFVLLVPMFLLAAAMLAAWKRLR